MKFRTGVIFDFDGVLADSEGFHRRAFQQVFAAHGWTLTNDDYQARYLGSTDRDLVTAFARDLDLDVPDPLRAALLESKERIYGELAAAGDILYPDAARVVRDLAGGFALAIASGSLRREIHGALGAANLAACFQVVVGADDVAEGKPTPAPYLEAARRLGLSPGRCVAIEDSPWGLESARAAGLRTIGVTHTYPRDRLRDADVVVAGLAALTPAFISALADPSR